MAQPAFAEAAGSTPAVVAAGQEEPTLTVRDRQDRAHDEIISSAASRLVLERIVMAAVLRNRALAALRAQIT